VIRAYSYQSSSTDNGDLEHKPMEEDTYRGLRQRLVFRMPNRSVVMDLYTNASSQRGHADTVHRTRQNILRHWLYRQDRHRMCTSIRRCRKSWQKQISWIMPLCAGLRLRPIEHDRHAGFARRVTRGSLAAALWTASYSQVRGRCRNRS